MKLENRSNISLLALALVAAGCAAKLEDPERFTTVPISGTGGVSTSTGGMAGSVAAGGAPATGGTTAMGTGGMVNLDPPPDCVMLLIPTKCATIGCHATSSAQFTSGLDLTGTNPTPKVVNQPATYSSVTPADERAKCVEGLLLINPQNPMESEMYKRLHDTQACGEPMPFGTPLGATDVDCFDSWILSYPK
jgi:hypothetical protein